MIDYYIRGKVGKRQNSPSIECHKIFSLFIFCVVYIANWFLKCRCLLRDEYTEREQNQPLQILQVNTWFTVVFTLRRVLYSVVA